MVPTDGCYALCCHLDDKDSVQRLRALRGIDEKHLLTIMCSDLSQLASYAKVDNTQYRFLKHWTPGPYTFVLEATKEVPRRLSHPARKTIGLRVPGTPVVHELLAAHGEPVLASTLRMPGDEEPIGDPDLIIERIGRQIDLLLDVGQLPIHMTTIIDLQSGQPTVLRAGLGAEKISASFD